MDGLEVVYGYEDLSYLGLGLGDSLLSLRLSMLGMYVLVQSHRVLLSQF